MRKTFFSLLSSCLLLVLTSCPDDTDDPPTDPQREQVIGTTINCSLCTHETLCGVGCDTVVLQCHFITDSAFQSMRSEYSAIGRRTYAVSTIRKVVRDNMCENHRIIVDGNHNDTSNADIVFKLAKLTAEDKARATPVSYAFPLFKNILREHSPSDILFYKGKKEGADDILIEVIGAAGVPVAHYDLSDIPPLAGTYQEVTITE